MIVQKLLTHGKNLGHNVVNKDNLIMYYQKYKTKMQ